MGLNVCIISHLSGTGGAERAIPKLAEKLQSNGVKVHMLIPYEGPIEKDLKEKKISYKIIPFRLWVSQNQTFWGRVRRTIRNIIAIIPVSIYILKCKSNLVYTNTSTVCTAAFSAKLLFKPHVWHFREFGFEDHGFVYDWGENFSLWLINKLSSYCIANSKAVAEKYKKYIPESKIEVIYEGYDEEFTNDTGKSASYVKNTSKPKCALIGSLYKTKRQVDALLAIHNLKQKGLEVELYLAGDGKTDYKNYLSDLVKKYDLAENVIFLGYINNPQELMRQCDIILMCSVNEAFGIVTIEAMQAGKPVIGTNSGGTRELIRDGYNGLLYKPMDHNDLSSKIQYLIENQDISKKFGRNGKELASTKFTIEKYSTEVLNTLSKIRK